MGHQYRYLAQDWMTGDILGELPLRGVSFSDRLNDVGALTATLPLDNDEILNQVQVDACIPARTVLHVERDGVLVWSGPIWHRRFSSERPGIEITAATLWSYLRRRQIIVDQISTNTDQHAIASGIFQQAVGQTGSPDMDQSHSLSGVLRDRSYYAYEGKQAGEAIEQLAAVENGFDFSLQAAWDGGAIVTTFRTHYPRRGLDHSATGYTFETGRNIRHYEWPEDGMRVANKIQAFGEGEGVNRLAHTAVRMDALANGYPILEMAMSWNDVKNNATLVAHAQANVDARVYPVVLPEMSVDPDGWPDFGAWQLGDEIMLVLGPDPFFADRTPWLRRIIAWRMAVSDEGGESLTITSGLESS